MQFYFDNNRSIVAILRANRRHFGVTNNRAEMKIRHIIQRFEAQGSVFDQPRSGRSCSTVTDANVHSVE